LGEKFETTVADTANDPEAALQEKNRGELLRQALTRLSLDHRKSSTSFTITRSRLMSARGSSASLLQP
jgi:hypothetical protein